MFANNWTATNTGQRIDLTNPSPDSILLTDIAYALSKICRFNGQLKRFYSVAQHSLHVAELVPEHLKLQALLHDASEAYICDVPTPFKRMLGSAYTDVENKLQRVIGEKFGVELVALDPLVKAADRVMVVSERDQLQSNPVKWGAEYEDVLRYPQPIPLWSNDTAAAKFLAEVAKFLPKK